MTHLIAAIVLSSCVQQQSPPVNQPLACPNGACAVHVIKPAPGQLVRVRQGGIRGWIFGNRYTYR